MKIILKPDWDISSQTPNKEKTQRNGHFVGRKKELSVLFNELSRREQGAILISGHRGVGKTSFVHKVLQDLIDHYHDKTIIPVLLNSASLDTEKNRGKILVNLIRRLYTATLDETLPSHLRQEIEALYKKAASSEFKYVEASEKNQQLKQEIASTRNFTIGADTATSIVWLVCFVLAIFTQIYPIPGIFDWLNKILPLLLAFPIPLIISIAWQYSKTNSKLEQSSNSAQRLYTLDNSVSNLEFDLDRLHRHLSKEEIKTIYVIDELDKLDVRGVSEILKYLKNLFTLSKAIFLFVGGEELSNLGKPENRNRWERPLEYTYFTSKYFLARPTTEELFDFLDEITEKVEGNDDLQEYDYIKRSFILDAKCDFYELLQVIKGNITGFSSGIFPEIDKKLDDEIVRKAKMQQIISLLYAHKYFAHHPSKWAENETVLRTFYDGGVDILSKVTGERFENSGSSEKSSLANLALSDLLRYLYKLGIVDLEKEEKTERRNFGDVSRDVKSTTTTYSRTGFIPEVIPTQLSFPSQLDEELITSIEKYYNVIVNCWNITSVFQETQTISLGKIKENPLLYTHFWGPTIKNLTKEVERIYKQVSNSSNVPTREEIEKYIQITNTAREHITSDLHNFFANLIRDSLTQENYEISTLNDYAHPLPEEWEHVKQDLFNSNAMHSFLTNDNGYRILICNGQIKATKEISFTHSNRDKQIIVNIHPQNQNPIWNYHILQLDFIPDISHAQAQISYFANKIRKVGEYDFFLGLLD